MKNILSLTLLFLLALFFYWPILSGHEHLFFRDTLLQTLPGKWFLKNNFHGVPALWNPYIFMGFPQFSIPSYGSFYPLNFIFAFGPIDRTYPWYIFTHFLLALGFTYGFVKMLTQREEAGLFAAVAFGFSGFIVFSAAAHVGFVTAVWLPAILYFLKRSEQNDQSILAAGLCGACQILAGEMHYCAMTFLIVTGFCLATWNARKAWKAIAIYLAITIGLAAVQIIPTLEFLPLSSRGNGLSWEEATTWSFHPLRLLEFITPFPFGSIYPSFRNYHGGQYFPLRFQQPFILSVYFGMVPILFFFLSAREWGQKHNRLWLGMGLLFLLLSFGQWSPFFKVLHHLPFFSSFRYPEKFMWVATFCFIIISSKTFSKINTSHFFLSWLILLLSIVDLFVFSKQVFFTTPLDIPALRTAWMGKVDDQRFMHFSDFQPRFPLPPRPEIELDHAISFLSGRENTQTMLNRAYTLGYDGLTLGRSSDLPFPNITKRFLNETGTRWILTGYQQPVPEHLNLEYESKSLNLSLWKNLESLPLIYLQSPQAQPKALNFQRSTPDEIRITLLQGEVGELVVNETNYPGWHASVDGKAAPLIKKGAFGKFVNLTGKERDIVFRFQPWSFRLGFTISLTTLLLMGIFALGRQPEKKSG